MTDETSEFRSSPDSDSERRPVVVGVGASAGGLDAMMRLFSSLPEKPPMSFVVIQHLAPTHDSALTEILQRKTELAVREVNENVQIEDGYVYVIPPGKYLAIEGCVLRLSEPTEQRGARMSIDHFFRSLAEDLCEYAVGVLLSGTGTDGTAGLKEIKMCGGLTVVQDPHDAEHNGMPQSAINALEVDFTLTAEQIGHRLVSYVQHAREHSLLSAQDSIQHRGELETITKHLREKTGADFRRYRHNTILRRIRRRMGLQQLASMRDYLHVLKDDAKETALLKNDLLIGVTRFFRNPAAWKVLEKQLLRPIFENSEPDKPIRVWCAGCATGEEVYSLAMLCHEHADRSSHRIPIQVFATDISSDALSTAREGLYPESVVADVNASRLQQFFHKSGNHYQVSRRLRESIVFAEQNVLSHPPFAQLDLVVCRNLMIYLDRPAQRRVLDVFQFALKEGCGLFLGSSESIGEASRYFTPIDKRWRLYKRTATTPSPPISPELEPSPTIAAAPLSGGKSSPRRGNLASLVQRQMIREAEIGIAVVNADDRATYLQGPIDRYLQSGVGELGGQPPFVLDLVREGLRSKVRPLLRSVRESFDTQVARGRVRRDDGFHPVRVIARPLRGQDGAVLLSFLPDQSTEIKSRSDDPPTTQTDASAAHVESPKQPAAGGDSLVESLRAEVAELTHELETTRQQLSTTIEDLETANEELQAANEESMAVNEELQAGNEELETSKEELQSLNEELVTLNNQLELKLNELQDTTDDLNNLLISTHLPTVFVDTHLRIRRFTPSATELFHLIASDTGRPLSDIRADFDVEELLDIAREVLETLRPVRVDVETADAKSFLARVQPYRTEDNHIRGVVLTFSDVTELKRSKETAENRLAELHTIYESTPIGLSFIGKDRKYRSINQKLAEINGLSVEDTLGKTLREVLPDPLGASVAQSYERVFETGEPIELEITGETKADDQPHHYRASYHPVFAKADSDNRRKIIGVNSVVEDITELKRMQLELATNEERLRQIANTTDYVFWIVQTDPFKVLYVSPAYEFVSGREPEKIYEDPNCCIEAIVPEDRNQVLDEIEKFRRDPMNSSLAVEYRIERDDEIRWIRCQGNAVVEEDGSSNRIAGIARDITESKSNLERLEFSERRARLATELASVGVIEIDYETDAVIMDEKAAATFNLPAHETLSRDDIHDRFHPDERDELLATLERFIEDPDRNVDEFEHRLLLDDGEVRWVRACKRVKYRWSGKNVEATGCIVAVLNKTDEYKQKNRLADAKQNAESANRSRGEFLANMSHEIRTPMAAILGHADILRDHLKDPDNLSVVDTIRRNGKHLIDIINDILDLSKIDAGKMVVDSSPVRPDAIIGEVRSLMDVRATEKKLPLKIEFDGPVPETIDTDPVRLRQILLNLTGNAIKFTNSGEVRLVIRYDENAGWILFDVIDTGLGIKQEKLESMFHPFTQDDTTNTRSAGGTGLGLAICRRLADALGGEVEAESEFGKGSRFQLKLLVSNPGQLIEPNLNRERPIDSTTPDLRIDCTVLVVDDRRDIRFLAQHFVEKAGGIVHTATNGKEAVAFVFADDRPDIDLIILDMQMPVMDGYEAAAEMRKRGCEVPIIALTANAMKEDHQLCLDAGCDSYLSKPIDARALISKISELLERSNRT